LCATKLEPIGLVGRKIVLGDNFGEVSAPQRQEGARARWWRGQLPSRTKSAAPRPDRRHPEHRRSSNYGADGQFDIALLSLHSCGFPWSSPR
jgi:hypothetical protein